MNTEEYIRAHRTENIQQLALRLHSQYPEEARHILQQIEGWQRLRTKVPTWADTEGIQYPVRLSLEQCSSETTARYKASVVRPKGLFIDLTGGLGVDFAFIATSAARAIYVEQNADLCTLARHNLPLLGLPHAQVVEGDGVAFLQDLTERAEVIYLDPFRRDDNGHKTVRIEDCRPNVLELLPLLRQKAERIAVKLSPMLDLTQALRALRQQWGDALLTAHIVGTQGEVKEILILMENNGSGVRIVCHDDVAHLEYSPEQTEGAACAILPEGTDLTDYYLYEPSPVLMKAGCYALLSQRYGVQSLHPNSHLFVSPEHVADFPGRHFRILGTTGFGKRELRDFLATAASRQGQGKKIQANLAVRNFPMSVAELAKRLHTADGGNEYWFATTLQGEIHILLACTKA